MKAQAAMQQIEQAALTDKQYRAARRLLDQAAVSGHLKITKEAAQTICTTTSLGATRRLLGQLKEAGIVNYRINGYVYVDFYAWCADGGCAESDHPRALSDHQRAESDHPRALSDHDGDRTGSDERAESDHPRALSDHQRAESDHPRALSDHNEPATYTHTRARVGWLVGITTPLEEIEEPTNQPRPKATPDPEEAAAAFGLLKASGVIVGNAKRLAEELDLGTIRRAVGHWWDNHNGEFRSPGIIVSWLNAPEEAGLPECSSAFERSPLYRQWRTPAEIEEERLLRAAPVATLAHSPPDRESLDPLIRLWADVVAQCGEAGREWLSSASLSELSDERACIVAPDRHVEYIQSRLAKLIRRALAISGHRPETIIVQGVGDG